MWALGYDGARAELWDCLDSILAAAFLLRLNNDGDVDLADLSLFLYCLSGPDVHFSTGHFCLSGDPTRTPTSIWPTWRRSRHCSEIESSSDRARLAGRRGGPGE